MLAGLLIMVVLPILCTVALVTFVHDATVTTKVEWKVAATIPYPNITICNARFFDTRLLRSELCTNY